MINLNVGQEKATEHKNKTKDLEIHEKIKNFI